MSILQKLNQPKRSSLLEKLGQKPSLISPQKALELPRQYGEELARETKRPELDAVTRDKMAMDALRAEKEYIEKYGLTVKPEPKPRTVIDKLLSGDWRSNEQIEQEKQMAKYLTPEQAKEQGIQSNKFKTDLEETIKSKFGVDVADTSIGGRVNKAAAELRMNAEQRKEYGQLLQDYIQSSALDKPFRAGVAEGFTVQESMENLREKAPEQTQALEQSGKFKVGRFVGTAGRYSTMYNLLGGGIEQGLLKLGSKVGVNLGKGLGGRLITEFGKDVALSAPMTALESITTGRTLEETKKDVVYDLVVGAVMNGVFEGVAAGSKLFGSALKNKFANNKSNLVKELVEKGVEKEAAESVVDGVLKQTDWDNVAKEGETIYVNQFGVADTKPFDQLQLQAPRGIDVQAPKQPFEVQPEFRREVPRTVLPGERPKLSERIATEQPRIMAEDAGIPRQPKPAIVQGIVSDKEPIDTLSLVMTEMPQKSKVPLRDTAERVRQELISKNVPFETLSRKTKDPTLQAAASNLNRTTGTIDYNISKAQSDMEGNQIGESIQGIFGKVKESEKPQFYDYVLNKHNVQRFDEGKPVFGDTVSSDFSLNKVAQYEAKYPQFKQQQEQVTKYFNNLLNEWGVKSGLVSEDTAKMLNDLYPNYVPTYRAKDIAKSMGGDGNFVSQILKKAKGSESDILPIDQQMAILTDRTIRNARKNEVMTMLDDVYQANPEIASRYVSNVKKLGEKSKVSDILDVGKELDVPVVKEGDKYLVNFYRNGEPYQMTINKTLYEAIRTMERDGLDKGLDVIRKYATNPFKGLITTYNPLFAVRNIMRDIPTALIYSNDSMKLIQSVPEATKEMLTNGKLWNQYQSLGGTRSGLFNYDKGVKIEFDGKKRVVRDFAKSAAEKVEALNNFTETLPRFAEYVASIKKGEPPMLALMRAAEITTDFSRFGKQTKRADAVVPYLNASVQGLDKFFRQLRDKPIQTIAKGGLVVTVPALLLDQANKDDPAYNEMSSRERNNYYHIPKGDGTYYRIPRSREVGVLFGTLAEWITRSQRGQKVTGKEIEEVLKENFTPVNGFDSNILKPAMNFINIVTGKDVDAKNYFGANIVSKSLQNYSPEMQYTEKTSVLSKALGAYLDVPPVAIDYLIDSYTGIIGDVGLPLLSGKELDLKAPIKSAFIADPVFKSESVNNFYDNLDKLNKLSADANKKYSLDSKLITPYEEERNKLNKISKELSDLRKEQTKAQAEGDEEKVRSLREAMNKIAKKASEEVLSEEKLNRAFELYLESKKKSGEIK